MVEEALRRLAEEENGRVSTEKETENGRAMAETVMIGDRKFDVAGGKEHGLVTVGVTFGYSPEGELEEANPDYLVDSVEELGRLLGQ